MRLPSKVTPFRESVFSQYPPILKSLEKEPQTPDALYLALGSRFDNAASFVEVLDQLYALGKIELNEEGLLRYVS